MARVPRYAQSTVTIRLRSVTNVLGTFAGFFAIYLFVTRDGWLTGLGYWIGSGMTMAFVAIYLMDGLRPILALLAFVIGLGVYASR